jgi:hypothetical protein
MLGFLKTAQVGRLGDGFEVHCHLQKAVLHPMQWDAFGVSHEAVEVEVECREHTQHGLFESVLTRREGSHSPETYVYLLKPYPYFCLDLTGAEYPVASRGAAHSWRYNACHTTTKQPPLPFLPSDSLD